MASISILHLSDLHLAASDSANQAIVLQALWKDVERLREDGIALDLVFFSGDLVAKGDFSDTNSQRVTDLFFGPLLKATGLPKERVLVVPGNHDVNLKGRHQFAAAALSQIKSQDDISRYFTEAKRCPVPDGLESFNSLINGLNLLAPTLSTAHYRTYRVDANGIAVGICALNTSWRATGAADDADYGKLLMGRYQLDECIQSLGECDLLLGMFHHPIYWLAPFDSAIVNRQLHNRFDGVFYGHNHESDGTLIAGSMGSYFASNAGCLYQSRDYFNGYSIVTYDSSASAWSVRAREYFESRMCFDASLRFAPGGTQTYAIVQPEPAVRDMLPSAEFINALTEAVDSRLLPALISDIAPKSLRQLFVEPRLSALSERQMHIEPKKRNSATFISLSELLSVETPTVIIGLRQSGKTTLLHRICQLASDLTLLQLPPFASYIDLSHTVDTRAKILEAALRFSAGTYSRAEFLRQLEAGLATLCFDNLDAAGERQVRAVADFIAEFPKCRYFFATLEEFDSALSPRTLPALGITLRTVYIHSFGRKETRLLTNKWFGEENHDRTSRVDEILRSLARLNIPRSPFLISALLWIKESNVAFTPVNQSAILDAFVDGVLDKLTESKARSSVDATMKRHFLAALAEHLYKTDEKGLSGNDLDRFAVDYFASRALPTSSGPFLQELRDRGILIDISDFVVFKFDCVRAYFLATRLRDSPELLSEALVENRFLKLREEFDYFTGLTRDNSDVLAKSLGLLEIFHDKAQLGLKLEYFDDVAVNNSPFEEKHQAEFSKRIIGERLEGEKREELLDRLDSRPSPALTPAWVASEERVLEPFPQFVGALQTVSAILRNSELVEDVELKHRAYSLVTRYWSEVLIAVLISVEFLEDDAKTTELIASVLPLNNTALAKYLLKMLAPNVILSLAVECLGTPKLQFIIEKSLEESSDSVRNVLDTFLYTDLDLPSRFDRLERLLAKHSKNRFICELVFIKVATIYLFSNLSKEDLKTVRNLLTRTLSTMLLAKTHVARNRLKDRVMADFDRKRLLEGH